MNAASVAELHPPPPHSPWLSRRLLLAIVLPLPLLGALCGLAVFRAMPVVYEASALIEVSRANLPGACNFGGEERLQVVMAAIRHYRATHPASSVRDEELSAAFTAQTRVQPESEQRAKGLLRVTVRFRDPGTATALANAYIAGMDEYFLKRKREQEDIKRDALRVQIERRKSELKRADEELRQFRETEGPAVTNEAAKAWRLRNLRDARDAMETGFRELLSREHENSLYVGSVPSGLAVVEYASTAPDNALSRMLTAVTIGALLGLGLALVVCAVHRSRGC